MKAQRLYTGNTMTQENFNQLINQVSHLENREMDINDLSFLFNAGDTFENSTVNFSRNLKNEITEISISIQEITDRTPFFSLDGILFENELIDSVDLSSDFQVLTKGTDTESGVLINGSEYNLSESGNITFAAAHDEMEILVNSLKYTITKKIFIGRNSQTGKINKLSMTPFEESIHLDEQILHPFTIWQHETTGGTVEIMDIEGMNPSSLIYQSLFLSNIRTTSNYQGAGFPIILNFKEKLIISKMEFDANVAAGSANSVFSADIWGSNDLSSWFRLKRIRNWNSTNEINSKFVFDLDSQGSFQYLKIEEVSAAPVGIRSLQVKGFHPSNKRLYSAMKQGNVFLASGVFSNDIITVSSNSSSPNKNTLLHWLYALPNINGSSSTFPLWQGEHVQFDFAEATKIERIRFSSQYLGHWTLKGSNDGVNFVSLCEGIQDGSNMAFGVIDKPFEYKTYRLIADTKNASYPSSWMGISTVILD